MAWRTAGGVLAWHRDLKAAYPAAAPPGTAVTAWGTIGDPRTHTAASHHMPRDIAGLGANVVTAGDAPHVPGLGLNMAAVTERMRLARDPRVLYVIHNRRMFSAYATSAYPAWTWRPYSNAARDPHTGHAHLSVVQDARADGSQRWQIGATSVVQENDPSYNDLINGVWSLLDNADHPGVSGRTNKLRVQLDRIEAKPSGVLTDEQMAELAERLEASMQAAAERAVRAVLGELDDQPT